MESIFEMTLGMTVKCHFGTGDIGHICRSYLIYKGLLGASTILVGCAVLVRAYFMA